MMSESTQKWVIDTNVPKTANRAIDPDNIPEYLCKCVQVCVEAIEEVTQNGGLVLDYGDLFFDEYRGKLSMSGQPGIGDMFMLWVHYERWSFPAEDRVCITPDGDSFNEFPDHPGLSDFDDSDRKFIAVANAHDKAPIVLQAVDSKWWGWKDALDEAGIHVKFLCPEYIETKYDAKFPK